MKYEFVIYVMSGESFLSNLTFERADEALLVAGEMAEAMATMNSDLLDGDIKVKFFRSNDDGKLQLMEKAYFLGLTNASKFVKYLREGER